MKVLIVEGDREVAAGVRRALSAAEVSLYDTDDADDAVQLAGIYDYDLIVLGETLHGATTDHVLHRLRERGSAPILVLRTEASADAVARMLEAGADDYVVRPVSREVLAARAKAIVRRALGRATNEISVGPITLGETGVAVNGAPVHFTDSERRLLNILGTRKNRVVSKDALLSTLYSTETAEAGIKIIDVFVCKIRTKLRDLQADGHLVTYWGKGYSLQDEAQVRPMRRSLTTETGPGRILVAMSDGIARLSTEIAGVSRIQRYLVGSQLSQMNEKGWVTKDCVKVGRQKRTIWTITKAGRAELARRRETEQRLKDAA